MASITFEGVTKRFGDVTAVSNLDLEISDKEFMVLLGPSGCGKTTTMRMIAGLEEVTEGTLKIDGHVVNDVLPKYRDVAMVFQSYALYPHMTVFRNIEYPLKVKKVPPEERRKAVGDVAEKVELTELLDRLPKQLSGGQRQRVALARAIVRTPRIFLMDEPLSNLDAKLRVQMRAELKHLQHELAITTVYVTHDQVEAMTLADRVAVMNHGVIQQLGTPKQIYNDPEKLFVAGFIGSPSMNFIKGDLADGQFRSSSLDCPDMPNAARSGVILGIRPEDLSVAEDGDAHLKATVYSVELTGDSTLVTVLADGNLIIFRANSDFTAAIDSPIGVNIDTTKAYLFDAESEQRLRL